MIPDRHWWRTADGRLVPDGDPDAAFLAYPKGHEIPDNLAERVGLAAAARALETGGAGERADVEAEPDDQVEAADEVKEAEPSADKMAAPPADKAASVPPRRRRTKE